MLQQTTVATVIPYFERFIKKFPTVTALARAHEADVLAAWSGLGYYRRARSLHSAAQIIRKKMRGRIPQTAAALSELPGFGPYTAAAVASIAFGEKIPVIDGNVKRVMSRVLTQDDVKKFPGIAARWISKNRPGDFNQAMMELGATVCRPSDPLCLLCPLQNICRAFQTGEQGQWPRPEKKPETVRLTWVAAVIQHDGKILFAKRPKQSRLSEMWELPTDVDLPTLEKVLGGSLAIEGYLPQVRHSITHHRITVTPIICSRSGGHFKKGKYRDYRWAPLEMGSDEGSMLPTSSLNLKILRRLENMP